MAFTCPHCGMTSHNPRDAAERYCGHCHRFLDDEAALQKLFADEVFRKADDMELTLRPETVTQLVGLLQLACRHPGVGPHLRDTADRFIGGARAFFADCPAVLEVIWRGDDPAHDTGDNE